MTPEEIQELQELEEMEKLQAALGESARAKSSPMPYNPKPIFNNAAGWIDREDPNLKAAAEAGVDVQKGAPEGVHTGYEGFAINEGQWADFVGNELKQTLGPEAELRRGPQSGQYEYYDPVAQRWTVLSHSSMGQAAISKSADALSALGSMAGFAGGPASGVGKEILSGAAKTAVGTGIADYVRTKIGNFLGVNKEVPEGEYIKSAAKEGAIQGGMDVAGAAVYNVGRYIKKSAMGKEVFTEAEAQQLLNGIGKYKGLVNEINSKSDTEFTPFLHQLADQNLPAAQLAESMYQRLASSSDPKIRLAVAQTRANQFGALRSYYAGANEPFDIGIPATAEGRMEAGSGTALGMQQEIRQKTRTAEAEAMAAQQQGQQMVNGLPNSVKLANIDASKATREQLFAQSQQSAAKVREAYKDFDEKIGYDASTGQSPYLVEIDDPELRTYLDKFGRNTITGKLKGAKPKVEIDKEGKPTGKVHVDVSTLNETAKRLDQLYRDRTEAGMDVGYSDRDLLAAHGKILDKLSDYLQKGSLDGTLPDEAYSSWIAARAEAKRDANLFKQGFLAKFLAKDKSGQWVINDQKALGTMLQGKDLQALGQIKGMIQHDPVAMGEMKKALWALYESKATKNGLPSAALHKEFMRPDKYGEVMNMFFKNEDFKKLASYQDVAESMAATLERAKTMDAIVRKDMLGAKAGITRWTPEQLVRGFFSTGMDGATAAKVTALANKYGTKQELRNGVMNEIQMKIMPGGPSMGIDFNALNSILDKSAANLVPLMGPDYVHSLRRMAELKDVMHRMPAGINDPPSMTRLQMAVKGYVRPFSREGNLLSFLRQNREAEVPYKVWEALTNPDELKRLANHTRIAVMRTRMAGSGAAMTSNQVRDDDYIK